VRGDSLCLDRHDVLIVKAGYAEGADLHGSESESRKLGRGESVCRLDSGLETGRQPIPWPARQFGSQVDVGEVVVAEPDAIGRCRRRPTS
jgi:hypothetical protein